LVEKFAKVPVSRILRQWLRNPAVPIMFASAIPIWKKRSEMVGKSSNFNDQIQVGAKAQLHFHFLSNSVIPAPNPERVSLLPWFSYFFI
jgi:hypothetical protein